MKLENIKHFIETELALYSASFKKGKYKVAFKHLERIHIVSQPHPVRHTLIHLRMLRFALLRFKPVEILVQILYSLFSAKFSLFNIYPRGNTGGANAVKKGTMTIPKDLEQFIN